MQERAVCSELFAEVVWGGLGRPGQFLVHRSLYGACSAHTGLVERGSGTRGQQTGNRSAAPPARLARGFSFGLSHGMPFSPELPWGRRAGSTSGLFFQIPGVVLLQGRAGPLTGPSPCRSLPKTCAFPGTTTFLCPGNGWMGDEDAQCCSGIPSLV